MQAINCDYCKAKAARAKSDLASPGILECSGLFHSQITLSIPTVVFYNLCNAFCVLFVVNAGVHFHGAAVGMRINASKTKVMSAHIRGEQRRAVLFDDEPLEDVDKFKCLGSMFVANGHGTEEIRSRINLARSAFFRLQSCLWSRREISLRTKGRVYQAVVACTSSRRKDVGGL